MTIFNISLIVIGQGISLTDPVGRLFVMWSRKFSLSRITVYEIDRAKKGVWTLRVSGTNGVHSFFAKSIGVTNVDFQHHFFITVPRRRREKVEVSTSHPVIGKLKAYITRPWTLVKDRLFKLVFSVKLVSSWKKDTDILFIIQSFEWSHFRISSTA